MREFKAIYTIQTSNIKAERTIFYNTIEELKSDTIWAVSEAAALYGISGDFTLTMTIEKNGEYYDSDEATANYTNGVLTIEA